MRRLTLLFLASVLAALAAVVPVNAEPTDVTVRVISKGAKFIGTSMGGALVTLRDVRTGEVLAQGLTAGGTGSTMRIMRDPHERGTMLSTPDAAKFDATLDLTEPRMIEVRAQGPMGQPQASNTVTATQWLIPGRHLTGGDGWLLEMPGLVVDVLEPPADTRIERSSAGVRLRANVTMMCGCPITPGGTWLAEGTEVRARIRHDGESAREVRLEYAGSASQFEGEVPLEGPGVYEATVFAYQRDSGNTGLDRVTFVVPD